MSGAHSRQDTERAAHEAPDGTPAKLQRFQDLLVWRKAHALALKIYKATRVYPGEERFGLVSQMRRAAVSVPANIAEGFKKRGRKDKANFYNIAQGSLEELRYYIILSKDLAYLRDADQLPRDVDEVGRMLHALIARIGR
jgi:four helix bundle protein